MLSISDQSALETEARIAPLMIEKKRLFNDLLTSKGTHDLFESNQLISLPNAQACVWCSNKVTP